MDTCREFANAAAFATWRAKEPRTRRVAKQKAPGNDPAGQVATHLPLTSLSANAVNQTPGEEEEQ